MGSGKLSKTDDVFQPHGNSGFSAIDGIPGERRRTGCDNRDW